jgi:hypothetical protein
MKRRAVAIASYWPQRGSPNTAENLATDDTDKVGKHLYRKGRKERREDPYRGLRGCTRICGTIKGNKNLPRMTRMTRIFTDRSRKHSYRKGRKVRREENLTTDNTDWAGFSLIGGGRFEEGGSASRALSQHLLRRSGATSLRPGSWWFQCVCRRIERHPERFARCRGRAFQDSGRGR